MNTDKPGMETHSERIRAAFARQAEHFGERGLTLSSQEYLAWMVASLPLTADDHVLDVATGTGHICRAVAPQVKEVIAIDATTGGPSWSPLCRKCTLWLMPICSHSARRETR